MQPSRGRGPGARRAARSFLGAHQRSPSLSTPLRLPRRRRPRSLPPAPWKTFPAALLTLGFLQHLSQISKSYSRFLSSRLGNWGGRRRGSGRLPGRRQREQARSIPLGRSMGAPAAPLPGPEHPREAASQTGSLARRALSLSPAFPGSLTEGEHWEGVGGTRETCRRYSRTGEGTAFARRRHPLGIGFPAGL